MARVGRFARGGTGGSNLSQLVYDLMRSQMTRQANSIVEAYMYQYDYRGNGVPTKDYALSYLREYLSNSWITQADRDQINQNIQKITVEENKRVENGLVDAINQNPDDVGVVRNYIEFLRSQVDDADSVNLQGEASGKLFSALTTLVDRVGKNYQNGLIDAETFNAQSQEALDEYDKSSSQHRQILTQVVSSRYDAEFKQQNQILSNASADGADAYLRQLRVFKAWASQQVSVMVESGLAQVNENGDVVSGIDAAMDAQTRLNDASKKITEAATIASKEAASARLSTMNADSSKFLEKVNQVLGSNYGSIQAFAANQIDVNRFYSVVPSAVMNSDGFMNRDKLVNFMFGSGNSLLQAAKASGSEQYKSLVELSKSYGRATLVDDAAILFSQWSNKTAVTNGEAIENTKILNQTIADYQKLIDTYGSSIPADELLIHKNTLSYLQQARDGKVPVIEGVTAWDLANPYGLQYDPATGQVKSAFEGVISLASGDAATAQEIESGKILSASIGADGKWKYGAAVAMDNEEALAYLDISTGKKKVLGVSGSQIVGADPLDTNKTIVKGTVYNLGNGDFIVKGSDGAVYARNYDPFSGQTITYNEFKAKYTQRIASSDTTGGSGVVQTPQFVVGEANIAIDDRNVTTDDDALTSGLDKRIADLKGLKGVNPDSIERLVSKEVASAIGAFPNSEMGQRVKDKYRTEITIPTVAGPRGTTTLGSSMEFERGDKLASYAFRNTPMSSIFTPEEKQKAQNTFRAGERAPLGIMPAPTGVTPTKGISAIGSRPTKNIAR